MTSKNTTSQPHEQKSNDKPKATATQSSESNKLNTTDKSSAAKNTANKSSTQQTSAEQQPSKQAKRGVKLGTLAIIISLLMGGGVLYTQHQQQANYQAQIKQLQNQLAQTQDSLKQQLAQTQQTAADSANKTMHHADVRLAQQQKSVESLQLAIADIKGRRPNDWLLAESDYLVKLAGRKLFLEHDVVSATELMESADQRIAALNDPSLVKLRQSMANDITQLKTIPLVDRDGLVLRLTALQQQIDKLPLANAQLPAAAITKPQQVSDNVSNWQDNLLTSVKSFADSFITFRTRDGDVTPLLSPKQDFYLRENLKAKLDVAIKAVYSEQPEIYQTALTTSADWASRFLNQDDNKVQSFIKSVKQFSQQTVTVNYPEKLESQQKLSDVIRQRLRREVTTITPTEAK